MNLQYKLSTFLTIVAIFLGGCALTTAAPTQLPAPTDPPTQVLKSTPPLQTTEVSTPPPQLTEESPDKLTEVELIAFETYFQETMQKAGIPGAAVALVQAEGEWITDRSLYSRASIKKHGNTQDQKQPPQSGSAPQRKASKEADQPLKTVMAPDQKRTYITR